ncbi:hypothetical protein IWX90DRAFT_220612 [Phyllosticta citrichinensis]|uniref:Uncharacterized protein n=1 Tax=Phyllosticta citrichinensis TaxID=1130410 RepID=A0ABR1XU23_9PEZI
MSGHVASQVSKRSVACAPRARRVVLVRLRKRHVMAETRRPPPSVSLLPLLTLPSLFFSLSNNTPSPSPLNPWPTPGCSAKPVQAPWQRQVACFFSRLPRCSTQFGGSDVLLNYRGQLRSGGRAKVAKKANALHYLSDFLRAKMPNDVCDARSTLFFGSPPNDKGWAVLLLASAGAKACCRHGRRAGQKNGGAARVRPYVCISTLTCATEEVRGHALLQDGTRRQSVMNVWSPAVIQTSLTSLLPSSPHVKHDQRARLKQSRLQGGQPKWQWRVKQHVVVRHGESRGKEARRVSSSRARPLPNHAASSSARHTRQQVNKFKRRRVVGCTSGLLRGRRSA